MSIRHQSGLENHIDINNYLYYNSSIYIFILIKERMEYNIMTSLTNSVNSASYFVEWDKDPKLLHSAITLALGGTSDRAARLIPPIIGIVVEYLKCENVTKVFGEKEWEALFGKVPPAPPIPQKIICALQGLDPFSFDSEETKKKTMLFYIPEKVNDVMLTTLKMIEIYEKRIETKNTIDMNSDYNEIMKKLGNSCEGGHWTLIRTKIVEIGVYLSNARKRVASVNWEFPTLRDVTICMSAYAVLKRSSLFSFGYSTYCEEVITYWVSPFLNHFNSWPIHAIVGSSRDIDKMIIRKVDDRNSYEIVHVGVAPMLKG